MKTPILTSTGVFRAGWRGRKVTSLEFPTRNPRSAATMEGRAEPSTKRLAAELAQYLSGKRTRFTSTVDLREGTAFQRKVWSALQRIPYGTTRSYGEIARAIGAPRASRAVGAACGRNPVPILVPCHRVVAQDGGLGGFSAGLHWKKRLLALETKPRSR